MAVTTAYGDNQMNQAGFPAWFWFLAQFQHFSINLPDTQLND
jgi:hypothetical protein